MDPHADRRLTVANRPGGSTEDAGSINVVDFIGIAKSKCAVASMQAGP
jgi:hypothetical protein